MLLYVCVSPGFPVPQICCHPTRAAQCQSLTVAVGLPPPAALWRWQLKISSARLRYCVIFRFTASRRSLLGSTVVSTEGGHEGPARFPGGMPQPSHCSPQTEALVPSTFSQRGCTGPLAAVPGGMRWSPRCSPQRVASVHPPTLPGEIPLSRGHSPQRDAPILPQHSPEGCSGPLTLLPVGMPGSPRCSPQRDAPVAPTALPAGTPRSPGPRGGPTHPARRGAARPRRSGSG